MFSHITAELLYNSRKKKNIEILKLNVVHFIISFVFIILNGGRSSHSICPCKFGKKKEEKKTNCENGFFFTVMES